MAGEESGGVEMGDLKAKSEVLYTTHGQPAHAQSKYLVPCGGCCLGDAGLDDEKKRGWLLGAGQHDAK